MQSPKTTKARERREIKFSEGRPMRYHEDLRGLNKEG
jgi:hypothetical protein